MYIYMYTYIHIYTYIYISRAFANVNLSENKSVVLAMHTVRAIHILHVVTLKKKKSKNWKIRELMIDESHELLLH
jgi:hypothetical protein